MAWALVAGLSFYCIYKLDKHLDTCSEVVRPLVRVFIVLTVVRDPIIMRCYSHACYRPVS